MSPFPALFTVLAALAALAGPSPRAPALLSPGAEPAWAAQGPLGVIRGRLDIQRVARHAERRPDVHGSAAAGSRGVPDLRRGIVYLDTAPRGAFDERETPRAVMDQRDETFVPHLLAVMVGTVVHFPNSDRTFHNVFSLSRPKRFDLGRYAAGRSKSVRFDRAGVVRVFCDIHAHMNAYIVVFNHPYFQVTAADGQYRLEQVPPGTYTLVAWYDGEARNTATVTVPPGGTVTLSLAVP